MSGPNQELIDRTVKWVVILLGILGALWVIGAFREHEKGERDPDHEGIDDPAGGAGH